MTVAYTVINRLAGVLASLSLWGGITSSTAFADDVALSLPQHAEASVRLALPQELAGNPADILQVFVGTEEDCCDNKTSIAGRYKHENGMLQFKPAFGFKQSQSYVVRFWGDQGESLIPFRLGKIAEIVPAAVTGIYPGGETLPENILRFYLHFSVPMSPHVAFDYVNLENDRGVVDKAAFMRFKQELWNEDRSRLTVLVDPGRIKRGVATNLDLGPALVEGHQYTLSISEGWPSADGSSVLPGYTKRFTVGEALRERPSVNLWQVTSPCFGTRNALSLVFDRPFDRYLLNETIRIVGEDGARIRGVISIGDGETALSFRPNQPWTDRNLRIVASDHLEDVAGNNFQGLLDQPSGAQEYKTPATRMMVQLKRCS